MTQIFGGHYGSHIRFSRWRHLIVFFSISLPLDDKRSRFKWRNIHYSWQGDSWYQSKICKHDQRSFYGLLDIFTLVPNKNSPKQAPLQPENYKKRTKNCAKNGFWRKWKWSTSHFHLQKYDSNQKMKTSNFSSYLLFEMLECCKKSRYNSKTRVFCVGISEGGVGYSSPTTQPPFGEKWKSCQNFFYINFESFDAISSRSDTTPSHILFSFRY